MVNTGDRIMTSGYVVANVRFRDLEAAREYGGQVPAVVAAYGGRYLVRGGSTDTAEGEWQLHHVTILEFPSLEQARRWYASPEYAAIKALRVAGAESQIAFIEGVGAG